jgi:antitoxin MazE
MYIQLYKQKVIMKVKVTKWGNSLGLRIPKEIAGTMVKVGTELELEMIDGAIVAKPVERKKYTLDELLEGMNEENRGEEIYFGKPEGSEIW